MSKLPFMQFYPADWIKDTQVLSLEAQGAWIKLLCAAWIAPERGKLIWTWEMFRNFIGLKDRPKQAVKVWNELINSRVGDCTFDKTSQSVTIMSRRMMREEIERNQARARQSRFRNADVTGKSRRIYQKSEVRSHISDKDKELVLDLPDWIPSEPWEAYLRHRKRKRAKVTQEAAEGLISKLLEMKKQGEDITQVLKQSVTNGWTGLFPIAGNGKGKGAGAELATNQVPAYKPPILNPEELRGSRETLAKLRELTRNLAEKMT